MAVAPALEVLARGAQNGLGLDRIPCKKLDISEDCTASSSDSSELPEILVGRLRGLDELTCSTEVAALRFQTTLEHEEIGTAEMAGHGVALQSLTPLNAIRNARRTVVERGSDLPQAGRGLQA